MKRKFSREKFIIESLKPRPEDIIFNRCTHQIFDKETGECATCKTIINPNMCFDKTELMTATDTVIENLECMKMIVNSCMDKKVVRAAQKYFDMIPLLQNIYALYDICNEELEDSNLETVDLDGGDDNFNPYRYCEGETNNE